MLHGDPEHLRLALALHARDLVGVIEELGLGQLVESDGQVHASTQAGATDSGWAWQFGLWRALDSPPIGV